jgi:hypothetical protein
MYEICVRGRLSDRLECALEGMQLKAGRAETVFIGEIRDQSQLYGLWTGCVISALSSLAYNHQ